MPVLSEFIIDTQPKLHQLVRSLDVLIRKADPDLVASLKWGNLTYHLNRNVCAVIAHDGYVNLQIWDGSAIDDPHGLLVGTGKTMRHIKVMPDQLLNRRAVAAITVPRPNARVHSHGTAGYSRFPQTCTPKPLRSMSSPLSASPGPPRSSERRT